MKKIQILLLNEITVLLLSLAWENCQHFATPPLVSAQNDMCETSTGIPYWWHIIKRSWECFWLVMLHGKFASANQKHYPDLVSGASSVWNSCAGCSDIISQGNQLWRHKMLAVFSGYTFSIWKCLMQLCSFFSFFFSICITNWCNPNCGVYWKN